jgi:hypothetical protein
MTVEPVPAQVRPPVKPTSSGPIILALASLAVVCAVLVFLLPGGGGSSERAIAQAINLRASDVPGFAAQSHSQGTATGSEINSRLKSCVGNWSSHHPGSLDVDSPLFKSGAGRATEEVQSSVTVQRSRGLVARDLAFIKGGRIQGCVGQAFKGIVIPTSSGVPVTITSAQVGTLTTAVAGSDGSFGMRVIMTLEALGRTVPVSLDLYGYAVGRDELSLMTLAIGRDFPAQSERQLSQLLVTRSLAHPH